MPRALLTEGEEVPAKMIRDREKKANTSQSSWKAITKAESDENLEYCL